MAGFFSTKIVLRVSRKSGSSLWTFPWRGGPLGG